MINLGKNKEGNRRDGENMDLDVSMRVECPIETMKGNKEYALHCFHQFLLVQI